PHVPPRGHSPAPTRESPCRRSLPVKLPAAIDASCCPQTGWIQCPLPDPAPPTTISRFTACRAWRRPSFLLFLFPSRQWHHMCCSFQRRPLPCRRTSRSPQPPQSVHNFQQSPFNTSVQLPAS
uniref:Uncharacterized protein n=1 Tax=Triticum urartu TaxID=4572 RepID=A0A8R7TRW9_TRIUA